MSIKQVQSLSVFFLFSLQTLLASDVIKLEDTSGLNENELQEKVNSLEKEKKGAKSSIFCENELVTTWENSSPTPVHYDWVELKSNEWIKGSFNALYEKELEFDSKEFDEQTFDFDDIKQVRTHRIVTISIQAGSEQNGGYFGLQPTSIVLSGILRINENNVTIIQGDETYYFTRKEVISIAYGGEDERQYWSGKINLSFDIRTGNSDQYDYSAISYLMRRTSKTRLRLDYIGNISKTNGIESANNHRINEKFDLFMTRKFYITALSLEYYNDVYQNISHQVSVGAAFGYSLFDTKKVEWDVSVGPALISTMYDTVAQNINKRHDSWAVQLHTRFDLEITKKMDLLLDYQFTKMDEASGSFKHHMITKSENDITSWLDFDVSLVWDYIAEPTRKEDNTLPKNSDVQLLVGLGVEF